MLKEANKIISSILVIAVFITSMPVYSFALDDEVFAQTGSGGELFEIKEKRTENSKTYETADNKLITVVSADALHYEKNGEFIDIDNTLVSDGITKLTNADNAFDIELPKTLKTGSEISVAKDGCEVSFKLIDDIQSSKGVLSNKQSTAAKAEQDREKAYEQTDFASKSSCVTYKDALENTDISYTLLPTELKENIILKSEPDSGYSVSYELLCGSLSARLNDDNSIDLYGENEVSLFKLPAPFMYDAQNNISYEIELNLMRAESGGYILSYVPSDEWLHAEGRAYPVTVDPVIKLNTDEYISDTFINEDTSGADNEFAAELSLSASALAFYGFNLTDYINWNSTLIDARLGLYNTADADFGVFIYTLDEKTDISALNWSNKPYANTVIDQQILKAGAYTELDITNASKMFYQAEYGSELMLTACEGESGTVASMEAQSNRPYLILEYININGINTGTEYHTQDADDAGKVYLNDCTGKLTVERTDMSFDGNIAPADITFYWYANEKDITEKNPYGYGWHSAYDQALETPDAHGDGYYRLTTGDGTVSYLKSVRENSDTKILADERSGKAYSLTERGNMTVLETGFDTRDVSADENGGVTLGESRFKSSGTKYFFNSEGMLCRITTSDEVKSTLGTSISANTSIEIKRNNGAITSITDGAGRLCSFVYDKDSGMLCNINYYASRSRDSEPAYKVAYSYDGNESFNRLSSVTYQNTLTASYEWSQILLKKITASSGYSLSYKYIPCVWGGLLSDDQIDDIAASDAKKLLNCLTAEIREYSRENSQGEYMGVSYAFLVTVFSNSEYSDSDYVYEFFNSDGSLYSYYTSDGYAATSPKTNGSGLFPGLWQETQLSENIIIGGDFEDTTSDNFLTGLSNNLSGYDGLVEVNPAYTNPSDPKAVFVGNYCGKLVVSGSSDTVLGSRTPIAMAADNLNSDYYVLSAWVKTVGENARVSLTLPGDDNLPINSEIVSTGGEWQKIVCLGKVDKIVFSFGGKVNSVRFLAGLLNYHGDGEYYIDNVQLEQCWTENPYNYVKNMDFNSADGWLSSDGGSADTGYSSYPASRCLSSKALAVQGELGKNKSAYQDVIINGKPGDSYTFGGFFGANMYGSLPFNSDIGRGAYITVKTSDGKELGRIDYDNHLFGYYIYKTAEFTLEEATASLRIEMHYDNEIGTGYFDAIALYDDGAPGRTPGGAAEPETDANTNTAPENPSPVETDSRYDGRGNLLSCVKSFGGGLLSQNYSYTESGNFMASSTDSLGNETKYNYDEALGVLLSVTDADGNITEYTYDNLKRLVSLAQGRELDGGNAVLGSVKYDYNICGELSKITAANGVEYTFTYNEWGDIASVSVGSNGSVKELATYEYLDENRLHTLVAKVKYANGHGVKYNYDIYERSLGSMLKSVSFFKTENGIESVYYTVNYGFLPDGTLLWQYDNVNDYRTVYMGGSVYEQYLSAVTEGQNKSALIRHLYETGADGQARERIGDKVITASIGSAELNGKSAVTASVKKDGGVSSSSIVSDELGRKSVLSVKSNGQTVFSANYGYVSKGENTSERTALISYMNASGQAGDKLEYSYTKNGSLAQIKKNDNVAQLYTYDALNQLTEETNYEKGTKTNYAYDINGNIVSRISYTLHNGTMSFNGAVGYKYNGDAVWKDRVTEIDGKAITYDESGNMRTMGEKVYTWTNFRCLDTYTDMNTEVKYTYNCDGIRTSKTIDGSKTEYTLLGAKITSQTTDGKTMYFYYDSNDEIFALNYNNKDYFYVKNLQGDILKILDTGGETVVEYTYDAWGNCVFDPDSTTNRTLAVNNPFRYRSYYYDKDSKLYFLQSRYYDPSIGRFISSDDIAYLGATGTVLSYNMFAYCENDAVNCSDPTGEWGADVHSGYYNNSKVYSCYKIYYKKGLFNIYRRDQKLCTESEELSPYNTYLDAKYNNILVAYKFYYGTYYWAVNDVKIPTNLANIIAIWCAGVDTIYSPWIMTNPEKQSWHFNIYWDKHKINADVKGDSRDDIAFALLILSHIYLSLAQKAYEAGKNTYEGYLAKGLVLLGMALHPLQDKRAHLRRTSDNIGNLWQHFSTPEGRKSDDPIEHWETVNGIVRTETVEILRCFYKNYSLLRLYKPRYFGREYYTANKSNYRLIFGSDVI